MEQPLDRTVTISYITATSAFNKRTVHEDAAQRIADAIQRGAVIPPIALLRLCKKDVPIAVFKVINGVQRLEAARIAKRAQIHALIYEKLTPEQEESLAKRVDVIPLINYPSVHLPIEAVLPSRRTALRGLNQKKVESLADSFLQQGQLQPIVVEDMPDGTLPLVFGRHRLEAAKLAGFTTVRAHKVSPDDTDKIRLAEIDENLRRAELSPAEEAAHIEAREALFMAKKKEEAGLPADADPRALGPKKREAAKAAKNKGGVSSDKLSEDKKGHDQSEFSEETGKATGKSPKTIARSAAAGRALKGEDGSSAADVAGTSLDNKGELAAGVKLKLIDPVAFDEEKRKAKAGDKNASFKKALAEAKEAEEAEEVKKAKTKKVNSTPRTSFSSSVDGLGESRRLFNIASGAQNALRRATILERIMVLAVWAMREADEGQASTFIRHVEEAHRDVTSAG